MATSAPAECRESPCRAAPRRWRGPQCRFRRRRSVLLKANPDHNPCSQSTGRSRGRDMNRGALLAPFERKGGDPHSRYVAATPHSVGARPSARRDSKHAASRLREQPLHRTPLSRPVRGGHRQRDGIRESVAVCVANANPGFFNHDQGVLGEVHVMMEKLVAHSDDVVRFQISNSQKNDTEERLVFMNGQCSEIGIVGQDPAAFPIGNLKQLIITPALPSLLLHIQHVEAATPEKSHDLWGDILIGKES